MNRTGLVSRRLYSRIYRNTATFYSAGRRTPSIRSYSTPASKDPPDSNVIKKPLVTPHPAALPRHEVHEGSESISIPFNPPGAGGGPNVGGTGSDRPITRSPLLDAALTTVIGLGMVFVGGIAYLQWYKKSVLDKIELAFAPGYDPAMEVATNYLKNSTSSEDEEAPWTNHFRRIEQDLIDRIITGEEHGHYFVLLGPKGSGKGTMLFDAMNVIQADGTAMCEAHPDLEVFRLRLGKALNYEFNEDSQTGLFQRRDPREGGPALDIERAMNKLEKVALRCVRRRGKPLVLIINNVHYFNNDDDGRNMLLQLQQRAESWAACGIMTIVFTMDDFWPFYVMRKSASRMHLVPIFDLAADVAVKAVTAMRMEMNKPADPLEITEAVSIVGGRLSYLNKIARSKQVMEMADHLLKVEKAWLLSQIGLIVDCDDDVMDEQKWSSCSWLLLQEFVRLRQEQERENPDTDPLKLPLPAIPYWRCRQIMTRADFLEELDRKNIIAIDEHHDVRPDSMLILHAARQVVETEDFQEILDNVRDRIDEIESLHRTRELTFKDLEKGDKIRLVVDKGGAELLERKSP
uniref:AAA protein C-terminal winged helix domain-containing protein n=1 Tax=Moniliophthora roreri TaxID=221103 RepID=A0A0W0F152_MONRR